MIKHVSGIICYKEPPKKLDFEEKTRHYSKTEAFESKKHDNVCSSLSCYLTL